MKEILDELRRLYPNAGPELNFSNPYETLVATMLSAQCTDKQVNKVTPEVFRRYPNAVAMAACTRDELYPLVKSCGFKSKAGNIVEACRIITQKYGGEVPHTMEELTSLPGVGRKTANVVLANAFGVPAHRCGYPRVPRQQPPRPCRCKDRRGNGTAAHEKYSHSGLARRTPLAHLSWPPCVQGAASPVRSMYPAKYV